MASHTASTKKKTPAAIEVAFCAAGLVPEKIPIGQLARVLRALQRLAAGEEAEDDEDEQSEVAAGGSPLGLVGIKRGSAVFQFATPNPAQALTHLRQTGAILASPEEIGENEFVLHPVEELSAVARSLGCSIVLRTPDDGERLAELTADSFKTISTRLIIEGETSISGVVARVGGATANRCALRVSWQPRLLYCDVESTEVARRLGQYLYENVVVHGAARWLKTSWRVVGFTVADVQRPEIGSVSEAMRALRRAGGSAWDVVDDPAAYLAELTGES
ncbi:MAG TPA: hypothetical protein VNH11_16865 [Pirellulales bacterium]|nr:hypothetical protein [Pirellulales bacterium]